MHFRAWTRAEHDLERRNRRTGRTTRALLEAYDYAASGERVVFVVHDGAFVRYAIELLRKHAPAGGLFRAMLGGPWPFWRAEFPGGGTLSIEPVRGHITRHRGRYVDRLMYDHAAADHYWGRCC